MNIRTVCLKLHLWLGLAAGLVIGVVCLTGALLTFEGELTEAMHPERYRVEARGERLALDAALSRVRAAQPDAVIRGVTVHAEPGRTLEMPIEGGGVFYVDPYDGAVIERFDYRESGWHTVMALHRWLLGGDVGKLIVGVSVLAFLAISITGVWVWWPKSRAQLRERTRITARRGWRRLNFDLHVALGIWAAVFLFAMAFTGLQWSFRWFNGAMYAVAGTTEIAREPPARPPARRRVRLARRGARRRRRRGVFAGLSHRPAQSARRRVRGAGAARRRRQRLRHRAALRRPVPGRGRRPQARRGSPGRAAAAVVVSRDPLRHDRRLADPRHLDGPRRCSARPSRSPAR